MEVEVRSSFGKLECAIAINRQETVPAAMAIPIQRKTKGLKPPISKRYNF